MAPTPAVTAPTGIPCNLQQLQTQLRRLRIDPEGSNVVMQGDVTRIVSMSNRDRRGLIDELAGVALFDTRIEQTRRKLDDVQERQERCRIVEQELAARARDWRKTAPRPAPIRSCGTSCNWAVSRNWCWPTTLLRLPCASSRSGTSKLGDQEVRESRAH